MPLRRPGFPQMPVCAIDLETESQVGAVPNTIRLSTAAVDLHTNAGPAPGVTKLAQGVPDA